MISDLTSFSDSVSIIAGAYPTSISYFDKDNNGINDICFIDGFNRTLNLLIRNNSGLPEWWFSLPLFETESSVIVSNRNPRFKTFYCFTWDKKLIEVLTADLKNNIYSRNSLYSPGKIKDLKIKPGNDKLYAAFLKDDYLGVTIFTPRHGRYSAYSIKDIHKNVLDAALSVSGNAEVYYAAVENDSILIGEKFLETDRKESEISTGLNSDYRVLLYAGNFSKKRGSSLYGFLNSEKHNNLAFFLGPKDFIISRENSGIDDFRIIDKNQLFFGELRLNSSVKVYLLDDNLHAIYSLDQGESKINHDLIAGDIFARSFFVKNMNTQAFHLVYINKNENCITIKELK